MTQKAVGIIVSLESTSVASLVSLKPRVLRYLVHNTLDDNQLFDLDL